jgi:hypothetical protein
MMAAASKSPKAPKSPEQNHNGLGDLHETVAEVRAEIAAERTPAVPRYTPDGILLNPEEFHIGGDGVLVEKSTS